MNPLSDEVWSRGLSYEDYRDSITRNTDVFDEVYDDPAYHRDELALLKQLPPLRVLAIGEDWCPDVYHTLPNWARIADELPGWDFRVFARDSHPDVMRYFLWKKEAAQRIPVYAFYDEAGRLLAWWSGRSGVAQKALDDALKGRTFADLDPKERKKVSHDIEEGYRREFRRANFVEVLTLLRAFFHVA